MCGKCWPVNITWASIWINLTFLSLLVYKINNKYVLYYKILHTEHHSTSQGVPIVTIHSNNHNELILLFFFNEENNWCYFLCIVFIVIVVVVVTDVAVVPIVVVLVVVIIIIIIRPEVSIPRHSESRKQNKTRVDTAQTHGPPNP